jgi:hypothetical protein
MSNVNESNLNFVNEKEKKMLVERLKMQEADELLIKELFSDSNVNSKQENNKKELKNKES